MKENVLNKIKMLSSKHNTAKESEHHFVRGQNLAVVECSLRSRTLIVKVRMRQGESSSVGWGERETCFRSYCTNPIPLLSDFSIQGVPFHYKDTYTYGCERTYLSFVRLRAVFNLYSLKRI